MNNPSPIVESEELTNLRRFIELYAVILLMAISFIQYFPSLFFGLTNLDDYNFILQSGPFDAHWGHLINAFKIGVFPGSHIPYYRPVFVAFMVFNRLAFGQSVFSYHLINVLLHIICVIMLFRLLVALKIDRYLAFFLCVLFAVHPVLAQAVAWVPGRNDELLFLFSVLYFLSFLRFNRSGSRTDFLRSTAWLALALFTKESGIAVFPAAVLLLSYNNAKPIISKKLITASFTSIAMILLWLVARWLAQPLKAGISVWGLFSDVYHRLPEVPQYIGKVFLPRNLCVYPMPHETPNWSGILAISLIAGAIIVGLSSRLKSVSICFLIFGVLLLPNLMVPYWSVNKVAFEHRLYLPIIGLLLFIHEVLFKSSRWTQRQGVLIMTFLIITFSVVGFTKINRFSSPDKFWKDAVCYSQTDALVHLMCAENFVTASERLNEYHRAYNIDPKLGSLNLRFGIYWFNHDSLDSATKYITAEYTLHKSNECHYYLMRIALQEGHFSGALEEFNAFILGSKYMQNPGGGMLRMTDINKVRFYNMTLNATSINSNFARAWLTRIGLKT